MDGAQKMNEFRSNKPFIRNKTINSIIDHLDFSRNKNKQFNIATCSLITGESGSGKTQIMNYYTKINPIRNERNKTTIPVLHYELQTFSNPTELIRSLLINLGDPQKGASAKNGAELYCRLIILIKGIGLEILILDEIQVIIERRSYKVLTGIADLFKDLIKDSMIPIVFMGMPWSSYLFDSNPQLKRRISSRFEIPPFKISTKEFRDDFRRLLKILAIQYGFSKRFKIEDLSFSLRCFSFSEGNLGITSALIGDAYALSVMKNIPPGIELFSEVLSRYGVMDENNPFKVPLEKLTFREHVRNSQWSYGVSANKNAIIPAEYIHFGVTNSMELYMMRG